MDNLESKKVQVRINNYIDTQLQNYSKAYDMNVAECIRYILTKFFDEYEREIGGKHNGK